MTNFAEMPLTDMEFLSSMLLELIAIRKKIIFSNQKAEVFDLEMSFDVVQDEINKILEDK